MMKKDYEDLTIKNQERLVKNIKYILKKNGDSQKKFLINEVKVAENYFCRHDIKNANTALKMLAILCDTYGYP